ncbi:acetyltransferase-like protein [Leishmania infantum JPCM5]|uniref:tRNA carboxymethyluridine synthase n=2 Tax=Leishmania infantum TaxID=5671 RepID=A0A6L0XE34_LEIIN|nr:acetyltransferase-like protein [Leishmania infantum JPCM5]CAC9490123.1 Elongator-like_Protein_3b_-_putative [Leishmania infantum]CAM68264.1 acetyltransferase-like protein [Leishmania infantum JPCM5]SUZ42041.1 Elongator-like_Protein_3b_-_putative [Leishmania infantum]|eukprot:XP_001465835.1 acetyltransferase-like protein [Leishmania infantum JPCM5]
MSDHADIDEAARKRLRAEAPSASPLPPPPAAPLLPCDASHNGESAVAAGHILVASAAPHKEGSIASTLHTSSKEARFEGRCMPPSFHSLLGEYEVPEEAKDVEDLVGGHEDFSDLPEARREALLQSVRTLVKKAAGASSAEQLEHLRVKASRLHGFKDTARKSELTAAYRQLVREGAVGENAAVEALLVRKKGKSHSGVLVVTVFMGPGEFSCPKDCHYCPNQPGIARSYLLKEPGVLRGFRNGWDPISQFYDRASALENNGHVVDKIELIILGGTFSFYPQRYAEEFMTASFYAANTYYDSAPLRPMRSLAEELTMNEDARCRIIGITVETRPDYISARELRRFRSLGVTRVQLGIQHLDDDILNIINRDCPTAKTVVAIQRLLDAGFKVDAHWMPDLPGSSFEKDMALFETLFSAENESFQVDQWKVYPTATVPFTKISEWYAQGKYKPYAELDNGAYMVKLLVYIMEHCPYRIRLNRIIRDIPTTYIMGGEKRCNLRQVIEAEMRARHIRCKDIRERECKGNPVDRANTHLFTDEFRASEGTEFYLSVENKDRTQLYGHLRLRLRDDASREESNILPVLRGCALIRELHTYGKLIAVSQQNTGRETQHVGVGTQLMREAERIAKERGYYRTAVIAGVGVRRYYAKLGYRLEDTYMVKELDEQASIITEDQVVQDDDNENSAYSSFLSTIKSFFGFQTTTPRREESA